MDAGQECKATAEAWCNGLVARNCNGWLPKFFGTGGTKATKRAVS